MSVREVVSSQRINNRISIKLIYCLNDLRKLMDFLILGRLIEDFQALQQLVEFRVTILNILLVFSYLLQQRSTFFYVIFIVVVI